MADYAGLCPKENTAREQPECGAELSFREQHKDQEMLKTHVLWILCVPGLRRLLPCFRPYNFCRRLAQETGKPTRTSTFDNNEDKMSAPRGGRGQSAAKRRTPPTSDRPDPKRRQVVQDAEGHENNPPSGSPRPGPKAVTDTVSAGAQDSNQAPAPAASEQERTQPDGDVLDDDSSLHEFCLQRDRIIVRSWNKLDRIISRYVEAVLVDNLPFDNLNPTSFPYAMLMRLSENPAAVSTNPLYAKYLFQSSIWNMLDKFFFSQTATEWACEQEGAGDYDDRNRTRGLAKSLSLLTCE